MNAYDKYRFWFEEILGKTSLSVKLILVFIIISSLFFLPYIIFSYLEEVKVMQRVLNSENHIVIYGRLDRVESSGVLALRINRLGLRYTRLTLICDDRNIFIRGLTIDMPEEEVHQKVRGDIMAATDIGDTIRVVVVRSGHHYFCVEIAADTGTLFRYENGLAEYRRNYFLGDAFLLSLIFLGVLGIAVYFLWSYRAFRRVKSRLI